MQLEVAPVAGGDELPAAPEVGGERGVVERRTARPPRPSPLRSHHCARSTPNQCSATSRHGRSARARRAARLRRRNAGCAATSATRAPRRRSSSGCTRARPAARVRCRGGRGRRRRRGCGPGRRSAPCTSPCPPGRSRRRCAGTRRSARRGSGRRAAASRPVRVPRTWCVDAVATGMCWFPLVVSVILTIGGSRRSALAPPTAIVDRLVDVEALAVVQLDQRQRAVDQQQQRDQPLAGRRSPGRPPGARCSRRAIGGCGRAGRCASPAPPSTRSGGAAAGGCRRSRATSPAGTSARSSSPARAGGSPAQRLARRLGGGGGEQVVPGREVPVDGRHRDPAALRHRRHRQLVERSLADELEHGGEHLLAGQGPLILPQAHEMIISY